MIRLVARARPPTRIEVDRVTPERVSGLSSLEVARLPLALGNERCVVGDWFDVTGSSDDRVRFEGPMDRMDNLGAGMTGGALTVDGDAGAYVGRDLAGGAIAVEGSVGFGCALGMTAGRITISGSAGDGLGSAWPGAAVGMRGGTVRVAGNVGARLGERMRRGLILIEGEAGDFVGARMSAGTIIILGRCGDHPGRLMRRGTILALGGVGQIGAGYGDCGPHDLPAANLIAKDAGLPACPPVRRYLGDYASGGSGELLVVEAPISRD